MKKTFKTEVLLVGNTFQGVQGAIALAKQGADMILAVEETYLAADICGVCHYGRDEIPAGFFPEECRQGDYYVPDRCKRYLEAACQEAGVRFYYGLYFVEEEYVSEEEICVSLAGKGGIYRIFCRRLEQCLPAQDKKQEVALSAWVTEDETERLRLIRAEFFPDKKKTEAENLLDAREKLLEIFQKEKKKCHSLKLGRFADRVWNFGSRETLAEKKALQSAGKEEAQVIVVGGGTAGAMAALYAARSGAQTILLEPNYELGGTGTIGGVNAYWFGNRFADVKEIDEEVNRLCDLCGISRRQGIFDRYDAFHGGIKGTVLLRLCLEAGVRVVFGQLAYDVLVEGECATAVITAGREGNKIFYGSIIIDATGDADLAEAAGGVTVYGSEGNSITYWASLAQYTGPDSYENNFSSMVRVDDVEDMTRFISTGRMRGENTFDHGSYVSVRESRHIVGEKVVDLKDICLFHTYEDGIYTCFSNYDPKGKLDADMVYCGYLPPQTRIQIPLRAMIPLDREGRRIGGLYVAGKAVSATHNAFPSLRMQPDLMHQGAVIGMLAAKAVQEKKPVENLDPKKRRQWIKEVTGDSLTLPCQDSFQTAGEAAKQIQEDSRTHWIDVPFTYEETDLSPVLVAACGESSEVLPSLLKRIRRLEKQEERQTGKKACQERNGKKLLFMLKKLALFHGYDRYTGEIEADIQNRLNRAYPLLPERTGSTMCVQLLPDHGVMPEIVYDMNTLAFGKCFTMKPFETVVQRLAEMERDYTGIKKGIFTYIECIAYVAERSQKEEFIPLLRQLADFPEFKWAFAEENQVELMAERLQLLWFLLQRALYKLNPKEGKSGLRKTIESNSSSISKSAEMFLQEAEKKRNGYGHGKEKTALYDRQFTY